MRGTRKYPARRRSKLMRLRDRGASRRHSPEDPRLPTRSSSPSAAKPGPIPEPPGKSCPPDVDVKPRTDEATTQIDLAVLSATGDVPDWIVENGLEERERADRRDERDEEQHTEYPRMPLIVVSLRSRSLAVGVGGPSSETLDEPGGPRRPGLADRTRAHGPGHRRRYAQWARFTRASSATRSECMRRARRAAGESFQRHRFSANVMSSSSAARRGDTPPRQASRCRPIRQRGRAGQTADRCARTFSAGRHRRRA